MGAVPWSELTRAAAEQQATLGWSVAFGAEADGYGLFLAQRRCPICIRQSMSGVVFRPALTHAARHMNSRRHQMANTANDVLVLNGVLGCANQDRLWTFPKPAVVERSRMPVGWTISYVIRGTSSYVRHFANDGCATRVRALRR